MKSVFDQERFAALLDLAGHDTAIELTLRLEEDLTRVGLALAAAMAQADRDALHTQSHILLSIAGTIGATQVFELAKRLNAQVRVPSVTGPAPERAALLADIRAALSALIERVRTARYGLIKSP